MTIRAPSSAGSSRAGPSTRLKYATLGLLFVNVSIGGTRPLPARR
jgi:hypothetical protein